MGGVQYLSPDTPPTFVGQNLVCGSREKCFVVEKNLALTLKNICEFHPRNLTSKLLCERINVLAFISPGNGVPSVSLFTIPCIDRFFLIAASYTFH